LSPAETLFKYIQRIVTESTAPDAQRIGELYQMFDRIYADAVKQEKIAFSTLFARVGYVALKLQYTDTDTLLVQTFRKQALRTLEQRPQKLKKNEWEIAVAAIIKSVEHIYGASAPQDVADLVLPDIYKKLKPANITQEFAQLQVYAIEPGGPDDTLLVIPDVEDAKPMLMQYNLPDRNQNFQDTIQVIKRITGFPVMLNLIDCGVDTEGRLRPRAIIIEPDYLFDISTIAECFQQDAQEPFNFLIKKFVQSEPTVAMQVGNVANYFLDKLISEPDKADFDTLVMEAFKANPLQFSLLSDDETKDLVRKCRIHYKTILAMVAQQFAAQGIDPARSLLEPSFYSAKYGIQGRLDLFHQGEDKLSIVELKSGAPFHPNTYGLARTHFTQTLLYGLLIESVFGNEKPRRAIAKYILYSREAENPLRFAPDVATEQMEALQVRNQILGLEFLLTRIQPGDVHVRILDRMARNEVKAKGFTLNDYKEFQKHYSALQLAERKYFNAFVGFIAREHWFSRAGDIDPDRKGGHSALWKRTLAEKESQYAILGYLKQVINQADQPERLLVFQKTDKTNPMANFREGDIVLMYPADEAAESVLSHQMIKGTLIQITSEQVHVRLRHQQFNKTTFETEHLWHLEADSMETGFISQYQSLFRWASVSPERRGLLLGVTPPRQYTDIPKDLSPEGMLPEQIEIYREVIASRDYYLLWGPPGTGKTSVMLRHLAEYWYRNTTETVLFVAFTNRAVDEICEALEAVQQPGEDIYFRIGSEMNTDARFRSKLLEQRIKPAKTRLEIKETIKKYRIVVSTVSSMQSQDAIFKLAKFDRIVIDEASQLLEPQIIGLLTRCKRALLIGDHRQLPAVCTQSAETSAVTDPHLNALGIRDMRNSYFERMYLHATAQNWPWAYGRLRHQGRMHRDIMDFPARTFYGSQLETIPDAQAQLENIAYGKFLVPASLPTGLLGQRMVFWATPEQENATLWQKTNALEAMRVLTLYRFFRSLYLENDLGWTPQTFGVITPWRAQIAAIRQVFEQEETPLTDITIDTVERYQGGAREIIVLSLCTHSTQQMESLISLSDEGVDRKLNVALTRARKHLILLGNKEVLSQNKYYQSLIDIYELM
jgi:DNA replication ATP-dependent helicase Dna2